MSRRTTGLPRCQIFESERRAHHPARGTQPSGGAPAPLREHLIAEFDGLQSRRCRKLGHHRSPSAKNTLTSVDAQLVEAGFGTKISAMGDQMTAEEFPANVQDPDQAPPAATRSDDRVATERSQPDEQIPGVANAFRSRRRGVAAKTIRLRDKEHRRFVASHSCIVCGRTPSDPHHLRFAQPRALGRKVSDEFTVPVCRLHHREIHRHGDEAAWWKKAGIEPLVVALALWRQSHPRGRTGES